MTNIQLVLLIIIGYLIVYSLVNRICQCVEHCATTNAYEKLKECERKVTVGDFEKDVKKEFPAHL